MKLVWDDTAQRLYETGVQNGVLYIRDASGVYPKGVAWNGLISISESPSGAEATPVYADNIKYLNLLSVEEFGATIEAYMYPPEFAVCDGSAELTEGVYIGQQKRETFGMAYKTLIGNDVDLNDHGYKLHLIYGALVAPSEKEYATVNDSPEAITFSWELTTTPVNVTGFKPTASLTIDSTKVDAGKLTALETILFGSSFAEARLPLPDEIATIFSEATPATLALSSIVPADDTTSVALTSTIKLTFNNKIKTEMITVAAADGTLVVGTKAWDSTGKILTFTPTSNLSSDTIYLVTIAGVSDIHGQSLAISVSSFETVS